MYIRKYMMAWHVISNMEIGIFDIYFSHTIEYRLSSSLFFWIFGNIYSIFDDIPYHRKSNITIENRISGYSILAATDLTSVSQKNDLAKLIQKENFLVDLAKKLIVLQWCNIVLIQFIEKGYFLIQLVNGKIVEIYSLYSLGSFYVSLEFLSINLSHSRKWHLNIHTCVFFPFLYHHGNSYLFKYTHAIPFSVLWPSRGCDSPLKYTSLTFLPCVCHTMVFGFLPQRNIWKSFFSAIWCIFAWLNVPA